MTIESSHDLMHTPNLEQERWRESYYFMFYDFNKKIGCFSGTGYRPSKGYSGFAQVFWGEGLPTLIASEYGTYEKHDVVHPVAGLTYVCKEPFKHWEVSFDGELNVSQKKPAIPTELVTGAGKGGLPTEKISYHLDFITDEPPYFYKETSKFHGIFEGHIDEVLKVKGKLSVAGKTIDIDARGVKDHSWGVRDWSMPKGWRWVDVIFEDGPQATLWRSTFDGKTWVHDGAIYYDGVAEPITHYAETVSFTERERADRPDEFEFEILSENHRIRGKAKVVLVAPLRFGITDEEGKKAMMWNDRTVFECVTSDGRKGVGSAEFQFRVPDTGPAPRPLVAEDEPETPM